MLKSLVLGFILLLSAPTYGTVEILFGLDSGPLDFEDNTSAPKQEYSSANIGFHVGTRVSARLGRVLIGPVAMLSWHDMTLLQDFDTGADNNWTNQYYGGYLGIFLSDHFKFNLEYYNKFSVNMKWSQGKGANYFSKDDKLEGKGAGVGFSYAQGGFFYELMYQIFTPEKAIIGDTNFDGDSSKFRDPDFKNVALSVGFIF